MVLRSLSNICIPLIFDLAPPRRSMTKNYQRLWRDITNAIDGAKAVRTLAEILVDKEGRAFISRLGRGDAGLCIGILDHVSHDPYLLPSRRLRWPFSSGHRRRQPQNR